MKIIKYFLLSVCAFGMISPYVALAAGVDHFNIKLTPNTAKVGEALDLEIEAVDKNNNNISTYDGTILIFSESDQEAELPTTIKDNTYTFKTSDQGKIKFENAVKFKKTGKQDIRVYDLNNDTVLGVGEVTISGEAVSTTKADINIISPENGITVGENSIKISGTSQKNHTIKIIVNGKDNIITTTNDSGSFEKQIDKLQSGVNTFKAQILDANNTVIGESSEIKVTIESNLPKVKSVKITPNEVDAEASFKIEVIANEGLSDVSVVINDNLTKLDKDEKDNTLYTKSIYAPKDAGNYKVDVILKDTIGHETKELGAGNLIVKALPLNAAKETPTLTSENPKKDLTITGLKVVELKSKSIITWNAIDGAESYNVYKKGTNEKLELISNVKEAKFEIEFSKDKVNYEYFAIKAVAKTASGETYEGDLSEATKVQTGPQIVIIFILSLFIGGVVFLIGRKKTA